MKKVVQKTQVHCHIPTGKNVKSDILFSIALMTLSRPLWRNMPELVRTLLAKGLIRKLESKVNTKK